MSACTGALYDGTCRENDLLEDFKECENSVFPICENTELNNNNNIENNIIMQAELKNNNSSENISSENNSEENKNGNKYPPVPQAVLNRIPSVPAGPDANNNNPLTTDRPYTLDDVVLAHVSEDEQVRVKEMLQPFSKMWSGYLGAAKAPPHRIETPPEARPFRSQPYRAGLKD